MIQSNFFSSFLSLRAERIGFSKALLLILASLTVGTIAGCGGSSSNSQTVTPTPLAISTTSLPDGQMGTAYSVTLAASGGTTPYTWALTNGTLPAGLSLSASAGRISGTPTAVAKATALTFSVTDSSSPAQSKTANLTLTVGSSSTGTPLTITTTSLPTGQVGTAYTATLAATGGTAPYTWALTSGTFPAGIGINGTTGVISGTPTATASATPLSFTVTDSSSPAQSKTANLTLNVVSSTSPSPVTITTTSLPNGQVGTAYTATLAATGGTAPYTWALTSGTFPNGIGINGTTGVISGTPTVAVTATPLTFTVTDSSSPAQTNTVNLALTVAAANTLVISTTSLPNGLVGTAYSATLVASGGKTPYTWALTSGTFPAGIGINGTTGVISGTPTASANATPLTFTVTDSSTPALSKPVSLTLTIAASSFAVSVSPKRAGLVINQTLSVTPTTTDSAGVKWTVSGGTVSAATSLTGVAVTYTAPSATGTYTLTATSVTDNTTTATVDLAVTDLAGVPTYHNNVSRNGANTQEYALSPSKVTTSTFGKLFSCTVDGAVYAQPLWVPNLTIASVKHNVVFVATQHDSLYAFDADNNSGTCTPLWHANLIDSAHGANSGETSVPSSGSGALVGAGNGDIAPEVGVTGTPVIDLSTKTLYVVSKSDIASGPTFYQRLHAIDLLTGNEKFSGPVLIGGTYPGTGDGGSTTTFVARQENQRAGLALVNGVIYIAWAAHEDMAPWYGWVIGYNASNLSQTGVFNVDPNGVDGGIWMSGGAIAADASNNLYFITGNGTFDASNSSAPNNDYGDSFLKLTSGLSVAQYFTPSNQATDFTNDADFGAGGAAVLVDLPANGTNPTQLVIGGGKDGSLYVLNRTSMGGLGDSNAWQKISLGNGIFATGAFWNSNFYIAGINGNLVDYALNASTAKLSLSTTASVVFGFPGATPSVSSMPNNSNGIVWALNTSAYCTSQSPSCGPAVLYAFDATNVGTELWDSTQGSGNAAGYAVKFTVSTVANGKVYVGTRGNNTGGAGNSTSTPGELDVYGLLPN